MALPIPGASKNDWGNQLNGFLRVSHNEDGSIKEDAFIGAGYPGSEEVVMTAEKANLSSTREYDVRAWFSGGEPTGTGADVDVINGAIDELAALGYKTRLVFPETPNGYGVQRVGGAQLSGIMYKQGVELHSLGATFHMRDNCSFVYGRSPSTVSATLSANVAVGDTTFTVADATGLVVGKTVLLRLNTRPEDTPEPLWWTFATITNIASNVVTLDTPAGVACNVTTTTEAHNKRIQQFDELLDGVSITGTWNLVNAMGSGENAEIGIHIQYARNIEIGTVIGTNTGAGVVALQFVTNASIAELQGPAIAKQGGQASKGRVLGLAECSNVRVGTVDYDTIGGAAAVFIEHLCQSIRIDTIRHTNRVLDTARFMVHMSFDSDAYVDRIETTGYPEGICESNRLRIGGVAMSPTATLTSMLGLRPSAVQQYIMMNGVSYGPRITRTVRIPVTASMSDVTGHTIPAGFLCGAWLTLKDKTDVSTWYLVATPLTYNITMSSITAGTPYLIPNTDAYGSPGNYGAVDYRYTKRLALYSGAGVVADNEVFLTYQLFPLTSASLPPNQLIGF